MAGSCAQQQVSDLPEGRSVWGLEKASRPDMPQDQRPATGGPMNQPLPEGGAAGKAPAKLGDRPAPKAKAGAAAAGPAQGQEEASHLLNFVDTPLREVVLVFADLLGITVAIDPEVKGSVTLHSGGEVAQDKLLPLLVTLLELNGATMVQEDGTFQVVPLAKAKSGAVMPQLSRDFKTELGHGYSMEVFYLSHVPAKEAAGLLKPFLTPGGQVVFVARHNIMVVSDTTVNMKKLAGLVSMLDVPDSQRARVQFYPVQHRDAEKLAKDLQSILKAMGIADKPADGVWVQVVPLAEMKSVAVISTYPQMFDALDQWQSELDRNASDTQAGLYIYYCQNTEAQNIGDLLAKLFAVSVEGGSGGSGFGGAPSPSAFQNSSTTVGKSSLSSANTTTSTSSLTGGSSAYGTSGGSGTNQRVYSTQQTNNNQSRLGTTAVLASGVRYVVDLANNALVISAPRNKIGNFLRTVTKLDTFPKQVLIEVMIAEVSLDEGMTLGVEWRIFGQEGGTSSDTSLSAPESLIPTSGLVYALTRTNEIAFTLRALAKDGRLNIISSPILMAAENMESRINVGEEVPIITNITTSENISTETGNKIVDRSIEYRPTGILLSVTPRIMSSGLVKLTIAQEVSDISSVSFGNTDSPSFFNRSAYTNVITMDGQTVVIGGLIEKTASQEESGVPLLKDIPLLGNLFKTQKNQSEKKELIITLVPHVIYDMSDARELAYKLDRRMSEIRQEQKQDLYPWPLTAMKRLIPAVPAGDGVAVASFDNNGAVLGVIPGEAAEEPAPARRGHVASQPTPPATGGKQAALPPAVASPAPAPPPAGRLTEQVPPAN